MLPRTEPSVQRIWEGVILTDADAQVRLAALLTLAEIPDHRAIPRALVAITRRPENLDDRRLFEALVFAAATNDNLFLTAVMLDKKPLEARVQRLVDVVAENYARRAPTKTVQYLFSPLSVAEPSVAAVIVAGLARGWPKGQPALMDAQGEADSRDSRRRGGPTCSN